MCHDTGNGTETSMWMTGIVIRAIKHRIYTSLWNSILYMPSFLFLFSFLVWDCDYLAYYCCCVLFLNKMCSVGLLINLHKRMYTNQGQTQTGTFWPSQLAYNYITEMEKKRTKTTKTGKQWKGKKKKGWGGGGGERRRRKKRVCHCTTTSVSTAYKGGRKNERLRNEAVSTVWWKMRRGREWGGGRGRDGGGRGRRELGAGGGVTYQSWYYAEAQK